MRINARQILVSTLKPHAEVFSGDLERIKGVFRSSTSGANLIAWLHVPRVPNAKTFLVTVESEYAAEIARSINQSFQVALKERKKQAAIRQAQAQAAASANAPFDDGDNSHVIDMPLFMPALSGQRATSQMTANDEEQEEADRSRPALTKGKSFGDARTMDGAADAEDADTARPVVGRGTSFADGVSRAGADARPNAGKQRPGTAQIIDSAAAEDAVEQPALPRPADVGLGAGAQRAAAKAAGAPSRDAALGGERARPKSTGATAMPDRQRAKDAPVRNAQSPTAASAAPPRTPLEHAKDQRGGRQPTKNAVLYPEFKFPATKPSPESLASWTDAREGDALVEAPPDTDEPPVAGSGYDAEDVEDANDAGADSYGDGHGGDGGDADDGRYRVPDAAATRLRPRQETPDAATASGGRLVSEPMRAKQSSRQSGYADEAAPASRSPAAARAKAPKAMAADVGVVQVARVRTVSSSAAQVSRAMSPPALRQPQPLPQADDAVIYQRPKMRPVQAKPGRSSTATDTAAAMDSGGAQRVSMLQRSATPPDAEDVDAADNDAHDYDEAEMSPLHAAQQPARREADYDDVEVEDVAEAESTLYETISGASDEEAAKSALPSASLMWNEIDRALDVCALRIKQQGPY